MSSINHYLESVGLSLVHSLWQGAILVFLILLFLVVLRKKSAQIRYKLVLGALVLLPTLLILNLVHFWPEQAVENLSYEARDFSPITNTIPESTASFKTNPQSNFTLLWIEENSSYIAMAWLAGMVFFMLKVLGSFIWLKRMMNMAAPMTNTSINNLLTQIKAVLGIKSNVELKTSSWVKSPIIVGIIRPTILLPIGLIEGLCIDEVEAILYHELSHFKRKDFVINIIINVLQIVFFYHPTYWWLKSQLDNEREYATDEMALQYSNKKLPMIKALAKVQAYSLNQPALGFAGNSKNQVFKRINNMMNSKQQPNWLSATFTIVLLLGAFAMMSMQDQETVKQDEVRTNLESETDSIRYISIPIFHKDENDSLVFQEYAPMIPLINTKKDTITVSQAIVDLVQNRASFDVEYDLKGQIKSISKHGKILGGETLEVYKAAWHQIEELNSQVKAKAEAEQLRLLRSREQELQDRLKSIEEQKKRMQEVDLALLEREHEIKEQHHLERLQQISQREWEYQKLKIRLEQVAYPGNQLDESEAQLIKELKARMRILEDQMLEFNGMKIEDSQSEKRALERRLKDLEEQLNKEQNLDGTPFPNDPEGKKEFARIFLLDKLYTKTLIELDGKMRYDLKVSDLTDEEISKIDRVVFVKGNKMEKYAPKRKLKGIDWIMRIIYEN